MFLFLEDFTFLATLQLQILKLSYRLIVRQIAPVERVVVILVYLVVFGNFCVVVG